MLKRGAALCASLLYYYKQDSMIAAALLLLCLEDIYMTTEQALEFAFKERAFDKTSVKLSPGEMTQIKLKLQRIDLNDEYVLYYSCTDGKPDRYAMIVDEVGKYQNITFVVVLNDKFAVENVSVMVYREAVGDEVRRGWWLKQFRGKGEDDQIKRNEDVINITGATMSSDAVCRGIRKAIAIISMSAPKLNQEQEIKIKRSFYVMGSLLNLELVGTDRKKLEQYASEANEIAKKADTLLSNYKSDSEISMVNREAGKKSISVSKITYDFILASVRYSDLTRGAYDISIYPAVKAWGFFDKNYKIPDSKQIEELLNLVDYKQIKLDHDNSSVLLEKSMMGLDSGAGGKGFCVKLIKEYFDKCDLKRAFIDFRSSQYGLVKDGSSGWIVQILDPSGQETVLKEIRLLNQGLSTSGSYEKFFEKDNQKYCHILDPRTCKPVSGVLQVTLVGKDPFELDAYSTAVFVLGADQGMKLAKKLGLDTIIIDADGNIHESNN
ncbi:MAG: FAD:protein FMN transferase [Planctomycetes bacterium]|nr:FAD:protein FMN transferase [Planctomycetota bacterium]